MPSFIESGSSVTMLRLYLATVILSSAVATSQHTCLLVPPGPNSDDGHRQPNTPPCPPFRSPPTAFPFAFAPGCGHPSFQINCSTPYSVITINSIPFLVHDYQPHNSSLLLSPVLHSSSQGTTATSAIAAASCPSLPTAPINLSGSPFRFSADLCRLSPVLHSSSQGTTATSAIAAASCPSLPTAPINLSGSPFRFSADLCRRLSCRRPSNSSSCPSLSPWQKRLLSHPYTLFTHCSAAHPFPHRSCDFDIAGTVANVRFRVEWDPATDPYFSNCSSCQAAVDGVCGFNDSAPSKPFLCFPSANHLIGRGANSPISPAGRLVLITTVLLATACFLAVLLSLWAAAALRRRWDGRATGDATAAFLRRHHLRPPVFTFDQLSTATGGFDTGRKIGDGGFGSVYLAQLGDGRAAAVKRLHRRQPSATTRSFCNEILILSTLRHPNLVRLHGYCCDPRGLLLVYDYVPNGTLADHLHGSRGPHRRAALTWPVRVEVALQTAAALEYLHFALKPPVVHRDITTSNIFVERDMRIKVGDFGLSRLLSLPDPSTASGLSSSECVCCTGPQGTPGYLDPDYHRSFRLTEKSDVYSFGVVLLELITGMKAVDLRRDKRDVALSDLVVSKIQVGKLHQVVDPSLLRLVEGTSAMKTIEAVAELAFRCVAGDKDDRPDARELVQELTRIRGMVNDPPQRS